MELSTTTPHLSPVIPVVEREMLRSESFNRCSLSAYGQLMRTHGADIDNKILLQSVRQT